MVERERCRQRSHLSSTKTDFSLPRTRLSRQILSVLLLRRIWEASVRAARNSLTSGTSKPSEKQASLLSLHISPKRWYSLRNSLIRYKTRLQYQSLTVLPGRHSSKLQISSEPSPRRRSRTTSSSSSRTRFSHALPASPLRLLSARSCPTSRSSRRTSSSQKTRTEPPFCSSSSSICCLSSLLRRSRLVTRYSSCALLARWKASSSWQSCSRCSGVTGLRREEDSSSCPCISCASCFSRSICCSGSSIPRSASTDRTRFRPPPIALCRLRLNWSSRALISLPLGDFSRGPVGSLFKLPSSPFTLPSSPFALPSCCLSASFSPFSLQMSLFSKTSEGGGQSLSPERLRLRVRLITRISQWEMRSAICSIWRAQLWCFLSCSRPSSASRSARASRCSRLRSWDSRSRHRTCRSPCLLSKCWISFVDFCLNSRSSACSAKKLSSCPFCADTSADSSSTRFTAAASPSCRAPSSAWYSRIFSLRAATSTSSRWFSPSRAAMSSSAACRRAMLVRICASYSWLMLRWRSSSNSISEKLPSTSSRDWLSLPISTSLRASMSSRRRSSSSSSCSCGEWASSSSRARFSWLQRRSASSDSSSFFLSMKARSRSFSLLRFSKSPACCSFSISISFTSTSSAFFLFSTSSSFSFSCSRLSRSFSCRRIAWFSTFRRPSAYSLYSARYYSYSYFCFRISFSRSRQNRFRRMFYSSRLKTSSRSPSRCSTGFTAEEQTLAAGAGARAGRARVASSRRLRTRESLRLRSLSRRPTFSCRLRISWSFSCACDFSFSTSSATLRLAMRSWRSKLSSRMLSSALSLPTCISSSITRVFSKDSMRLRSRSCELSLRRMAEVLRWERSRSWASRCSTSICSIVACSCISRSSCQCRCSSSSRCAWNCSFSFRSSPTSMLFSSSAPASPSSSARFGPTCSWFSAACSCWICWKYSRFSSSLQWQSCTSWSQVLCSNWQFFSSAANLLPATSCSFPSFTRVAYQRRPSSSYFSRQKLASSGCSQCRSLGCGALLVEAAPPRCGRAGPAVGMQELKRLRAGSGLLCAQSKLTREGLPTRVSWTWLWRVLGSRCGWMGMRSVETWLWYTPPI